MEAFLNNISSILSKNRVGSKNFTIEELGEQNFSKGDTKTIMEEIEKYITSSKHKF